MELQNKILNLIKHNAQLNPATIAAMLDVDAQVIKETLAQMEKEDIILGYSTVINWEQLGDETVTAMIDVKVAPEREVGFNSIAERIYHFPEVKSVYLMSGTYDLSVIVEGKTMKEVARFVSHKLSTIDRVQSTTTHFILKRYKEDHFIFDKKEADKRLVVSP